MTARCYWAFTLQSRSCPFPYRVSKKIVFWHDRCAMQCSLQLEIMFFFSLSLFALYSLLKATMPANILISWCFWCLWTRSILDRQMYVKTGWCASSVRRVVCVWSGSSEERNKYLRKPRQVIFSSSLIWSHSTQILAQRILVRVTIVIHFGNENVFARCDLATPRYRKLVMNESRSFFFNIGFHFCFPRFTNSVFIDCDMRTSGTG